MINLMFSVLIVNFYAALFYSKLYIFIDLTPIIYVRAIKICHVVEK